MSVPAHKIKISLELSETGRQTRFDLDVAVVLDRDLARGAAVFEQGFLKLNVVVGFVAACDLRAVT